MKTYYLFLGACILLFAGALYFAFPSISHPAGAAQENVAYTVQTATSVWVGKDLDTEVLATSTGRRYLEIANISGATSTSQTLYCNVNGKAAVLYSGYVIHASSSKVFDLDNLYTGALHCKFPTASSTVTVVEF